MKKLTSVIAIIIAVLVFTSCENDVTSEMDELQAELKGKPLDFERSDLLPEDIYEFCGEELTVPLLAGKHEQVGSVTVKQDGQNLLVSYQISEPYNWTITETHLSVTSSLKDVPGYPRNPKIGLFNYNVDSHPNVLSYRYDPIPIPEDVKDNKIYILAHAVVEGGNCPADFDALNAMLPTPGIMVNRTLTPPNSYLNITISETGIFDGIYDGWCVDYDRGGDLNVEETVTMYSSYDPDSWPALDPPIIDYPEHIDEVNWILNQGLPNDVYDWKDVQMAIWRLLEKGDHNIPSANWEALYDEAKKHNGYVPQCGDYVGIICVPDGEWDGKQPTIIPYKLPCDCGGDETAWAAGYAFPGNSWAMYFNYCVVE